MPLIQGRSKKAFVENVKREMSEGKPQPQALAISYSIKRRNAKKKMANGGEAKSSDESQNAQSQSSDQDSDLEKFQKSVKKVFQLDDEPVQKAYGGKIDESLAEHDHEEIMDDAKEEHMVDADDMYADGGMPYDGHMDEEDSHSVADAIMHRKKMQRYAGGGEVDLDENAKEEPNNLDDLNYEALKKENYSEENGLSHLDQPEDSNEHGHELSDEDEHDMVSSIRKRIKSKRGM